MPSTDSGVTTGRSKPKSARTRSFFGSTMGFHVWKTCHIRKVYIRKLYIRKAEGFHAWKTCPIRKAEGVPAAVSYASPREQ